MLLALRRGVSAPLARLRRLAWERDPVLLLGREGRWRWPWVVVGLALAVTVHVALALAPSAFETLALRRGWIARTFSSQVFPFEPARPLSYVHDLLCWLPYLLPPLIVLSVVHGVSWRRAFSYRGGFRWLDFCRTATALLVLLGLIGVLAYVLEPQQHRLRWPGLDVLPWIALGLGAVLVQTLAEDVCYLGYLHRTWGAVLALRLPVAAAVTTVFIIPHLANADVRRDVLLALIGFTIMTTISITVLMRTQSLAASAGLHWANNAFILLRPTGPEEVSPLALVVYTDGVHAAGGSYLYDPLTYVYAAAGAALLLVMLLWRRSPFYLPKAPPPAAGANHPAPAAAPTGGAASPPPGASSPRDQPQAAPP